jgi:uncharacterized membrane protein YeaQ/YmgE (transglycosylase-associated protein family)
MNVKKFLLAVLAVGIVMNVLDGVVHGALLKGWYDTLTFFKKDTSPAWFIIMDFINALVLVWVYEKVKTSFAQGPAGGALFGFYAGVLLNFPTVIGMFIMINGIPYGLAWLWTIMGIVWYTIAGVVIGLIYKPKS